MKKLLPFLLASSLMWSPSFAQVSIRMLNNNTVELHDLTKEEIANLKATTTIFVYGTNDTDHLDQINSAFEQSWKFTKYKIVSFNELGDYLSKPNYSYFTLSGSTSIEQGTTWTNVDLELWLSVPGKRGKPSKASYCDIGLGTQYASLKGIPSNKEDALEFIYKNGRYDNWTPGYLKCYLKVVNDYLMRGESLSDMKDFADAKKLVRLRTVTLYIPEYTFTRFNKFNGNVEKKEEVSELLSEYPYKYQVISNDELSDKVLNSTEPVYFLLYVRGGPNKYVSIFNSSGGLIYYRFQGASYNLKADDFKDIVKAMK